MGMLLLPSEICPKKQDPLLTFISQKQSCLTSGLAVSLRLQRCVPLEQGISQERLEQRDGCENMGTRCSPKSRVLHMQAKKKQNRTVKQENTKLAVHVVHSTHDLQYLGTQPELAYQLVVGNQRTPLASNCTSGRLIVARQKETQNYSTWLNQSRS